MKLVDETYQVTLVHPGAMWVMLSQPDGRITKQQKADLMACLENYPERAE